MAGRLAEQGLQPADDHAPLTSAALTSLRARQVGGMSRRTLLRRSIGLGVAVVAVEWTSGLVSFLWKATAGGSAKVRIGTLDELVRNNPGLPIADGFPAYVAEARAFVMTLDPGRGWQPGVDETGDGTALNVRALSQICPHLGCRPNPCVEDFWFHCPCHQSRYDRKGQKPAGPQYGPADRSMDRHPIAVDDAGVLTIDTSRVVLGPLPIALGQPGVVPPKVLRGCGG
ncbi:MAG TPA: Rieske 2Fe-2S domain-containing protein [Candidatus Limnocylindrales bacterium]|nr:Rieske 2Fe-2S domain-containing protein [Candidatus Limnocylindrales bacterium]